MRLWIAALLSLSLTGCGYHLVGLNTADQNAALAERINLVTLDPFSRQTRLIEDALSQRGLAGQGLDLEILEFSLERRTLSELADRTDYELRVTLTFGLRQDNEAFILGPETLRRDGLLTLLDSNSDTLDADLEQLRVDELYRELIDLMIDRINAGTPTDL